MKNESHRHQAFSPTLRTYFPSSTFPPLLWSVRCNIVAPPHSIVGFFGRKKNPSGAPSSSGKQSSRWKKIWRWKLRGSNKISPVQNEYEVNIAASVTGPTGQSRNASNTATSVELLHSESCPTNNNPIPNDGGATAASKFSWDLAYEALREEKPEIVQAYEELLSKTFPYLKNTSSTADLNDILSKESNEQAKPLYVSNTETAERNAQNDTNSRKQWKTSSLWARNKWRGSKLPLRSGRRSLCYKIRCNILSQVSDLEKTGSTMRCRQARRQVLPGRAFACF